VKGEEASDISWRNGMVRFAKERLIRHATYSNQSGSPEIPSLHLPVGIRLIRPRHTVRRSQALGIYIHGHV
jgi:hypothetical protein